MMELKEIRNKIDRIDDEIIELLHKRKNLVKEVSKIKKEKKLPIFDEKREKELIEKLKNKAIEKGLDEEFIVAIYKIIIEESKKQQKNEIV